MRRSWLYSLHPRIELRLRIVDRLEHLAVRGTRGAASCASARPCRSWSANVAPSRMCLMPFSRQIRSNSTSPVPGPNRPVNTLPLSVKISCGHPVARASPSPTHHTPAAPSPARTTCAETTNREWSSTPDTIVAFHPSDQPHPADDVHLPQLHRPGPLPPLVIGRLAPPTPPARSAHDGPDTDRSTTDPATAPPPRASSRTRSSADPTPDAHRRNSTIRASTTGGI